MKKGLKAVILAGGKGTRLYPVTREIPKPLLPVRGRPILNHLAEMFFSQGIREIGVLVKKGSAEEFEWWKRRYYPRKSISFFEEPKPLGTFGGLGLLENWLGEHPFFLTNGDELKEVDLQKMKEFHGKHGVKGTIALTKVSNPQEYGVVLCNSALVKEFLEKPENPPSNYISSGLYLLEPGILSYVRKNSFMMIEKDIFPRLAQEKQLAAFKFSGRWMDCGTWERYAAALERWK